MHLKKIRSLKGFTLLELMISIVIATLLSLAVYMVYMATKKNSVTQEGISEIRDVGFVVLERFDYALKHAGFMNYDESPGNLFTTTSNNFPSFYGPGNVYNKNSNDELAINLRIPRFSSSNEMLACGGGQFPTPINHNANYQLIFKVNSSSKQLTCEVRQNGVASSPPAVTVLAENIERFKVFYQLRTSTTSNACDGTWVLASGVTDWNQVCSSYIGLVLTGSTAMVQPASSPIQTFELAPNKDLSVPGDTTVEITGTNNLRPVARMLHKIIYLRN